MEGKYGTLTDLENPPHPDMLTFEDNINEHKIAISMALTKNMGWTVVTFSEAKARAEAYVKDIFEKWNQLRHIVDRKESTGRKRWLKNKTNSTRQQILLAAWPDMPSVHRPDCQKWFDWCKTPSSQHISGYKWPDYNLEHLSNPKSLLLLLNCRSRHQPYIFAERDGIANHVGYKAKAIGVAGLSGYWMMLIGQETPETYGRLIWRSKQRQVHQESSRVCTRFHDAGKGLLILETQAKILGFLLKCCHQILADIPIATLMGTSLPFQAEPDPLETDLCAWFDPFASYRAHTALDTDRLLRLIGARRDAAIDHLWDLREDPAYFESTVAMHAMSVTSTTAHPQRDPLLWFSSLSDAIEHAYVTLHSWDVLYQQISKLRRISQCGLIDVNECMLMDEGRDSLVLKILSVLGLHLQTVLIPFDQSFRSSPGISSERLLRAFKIGAESKGSRDSCGGAESDRLETLFSEFFRPSKGLDYGSKNLTTIIFVEEMKRLFDTIPSQKKRLSSHTTELLEDLALIQMTLHTFMIFFRWTTGIYFQPTQEICSQIYQSDDLKDVRRTRSCFAHENSESLSLVLWKLDVASASAPVGIPAMSNVKSMTAVDIAAIRRAEEHLDWTWKNFDDYAESTIGESLIQMLTRISGERRHVQRTPEWTPPERKPLSQDIPDNSLSEDLSNLHVNTEEPSKFLREPVHTKVKTRGVPLEDEVAKDASSSNDESINPESSATPNFVLGKRARKVFSAIFHNPSEHQTKGEIPWLDFLAAMIAIGFSAEKLYGSVWQFTPTRMEVGKSIQFHEPHPTSKIPFYYARRMGRRLTRHYGLDGNSFEPK